MQSLAVLAAVLAALACYGRWTLRLLAPCRAWGAGLDIAAGVAAYCAVTAAFETSCTAGATPLVGTILAGAGAQCLHLVRHKAWRRLSPGRGGWSAWFVVVAVLLAAFLINAATWRYGIIDDRLGYLVFPRRIIAQGCMGRDAFTFRRFEAGLGGGGAYIYALFQSVLDTSQTRLADLGVGSVCLLLLVYGHARDVALSARRQGAALLVALGVVVFSPIINNTPETLGKAMLYALMRVAVSRFQEPPSLRRGAFIALLFCSLMLLKTSYLPPAAAIIAAFYGTRLLARPTAALLVEGASCAAIAMLFLLPWMVVSFNIAHTFWYPVLGGGTLGTAETKGFASIGSFLRDGGRLAVIMAPACVMAALAVRAGKWSVLSPLAAIPVIGAIAILIAQTKFTIFGYRYGEMGAATIFLFYVPEAMNFLAVRPRTAIAFAACHALVIGLLAASNTLGQRWFYAGGFAQWWQGHPPGGVMPVIAAGGMPAYQRAIPAGSTLVVLVAWPSQLDFSRNKISVMDWPGMIGPPGMPRPDDDAGWQIYLRSAGIRYFAYSYGDEATYNDATIAKDIAYFTRPGNFSQYQIDLSSHFRSLKHVFLAMLACGPHVFDDGTVAVADIDAVSPDCLRRHKAEQ